MNLSSGSLKNQHNGVCSQHVIGSFSYLGKKQWIITLKIPIMGEKYTTFPRSESLIAGATSVV